MPERIKKVDALLILYIENKCMESYEYCDNQQYMIMNWGIRFCRDPVEQGAEIKGKSLN